MLLLIIQLHRHHNAGIFVTLHSELIKRGFDVEISMNCEWQPDVTVQPVAFARPINEDSVRAHFCLPSLIRVCCHEVLGRQSARCKVMSEHSLEFREIRIQLNRQAIGQLLFCDRRKRLRPVALHDHTANADFRLICKVKESKRSMVVDIERAFINKLAIQI